MLNPTKIVCVGLNYRKHAEELAMDLPSEPIIFMKPLSSIIYDKQNIIYPPEVVQLDYEGELAVIIGKQAKNLSVADSLAVVEGFTIANDVTARCLQRRDGQWTRAKSFDTFCPLLPRVTQVSNPNNLSIKTFLNGDLRQDSSTKDFIFPVEQLLAFISKIMTLNPGDIILTGTPSGIGEMKKGDSVRVEIEGIGSLENKVI